MPHGVKEEGGLTERIQAGLPDSLPRTVNLVPEILNIGRRTTNQCCASVYRGQGGGASGKLDRITLDGERYDSLANGTKQHNEMTAYMSD